MCMHLTNYAVNKKNPGFVFNTEEGKDDQGHKRSFSSVLKVNEWPFNLSFCKLKEKIQKKLWWILGQLSLKHFAVFSLICSIFINRVSQRKKIMKCVLKYLGIFIGVILRFDIMLDSNLKPFLLEVNHTPSFTTDTPLDY